MVALPGQLLAIMGPSGSGKTTLLNAISHRLVQDSRRSLSGSVLFNGQKVTRNIVTKISNYVMQADHLLEYLTVEETIEIAARLKLKSMTRAEQRKRMENIMLELGLDDCRKVLVGGESVKGISGGQKKRVSVAIELLDEPSVLFLDEPTSGLDSSLAYEVLKILLELATRGGRTVICTVHQPRSQLFALFDQLLLLTGGKVAYHGPAAAAVDYFSGIGYSCPSRFNPADFFLDLLSYKKRQLTGNHQLHGVKLMTSVQLGLLDEERIVASAVAEPMTPATIITEGSPHHDHSAERETRPRVDDEGDGDDVDGGTRGGILIMHGEGARGATHSETDGARGVKSELGAADGDGRIAISEEEVRLLPGKFSESAYGAKVAATIAEIVESSHGRGQAPNALTGLPSCCGRGGAGGCSNQESCGSWWTSFSVLCRRSWLASLRNPLECYAQLLVQVFLGFVIGGLFFQLETGGDGPLVVFANASSIAGCLFFGTTQLSFSQLDSLIAFPKQRPLLNRETSAGLYSTSSFYLSFGLVRAPFQFVPPLFYGTVVYWMAGFRPSASSFFLHFLTVFITVFAAVSYCLMISALSPNAELVHILAPVGLVILLILSGFLLQDDKIPMWIGWFKYASFMRYSFVSFVLIQFPEGHFFGNTPNEAVLSFLGIETSLPLWATLLLLLTCGLVMRFLGYVFLAFTGRNVGVEV